jgi:beta-galactosidase
MPARVQKRDAWILKKELKCNIVRTSHYPQSPHFLDACDEYGLLVLEEIPGWQHIGDQQWKDLSVSYVEKMVRRDWNHPSIVLWGVRVNESRDDHDFYTRTNQLARFAGRLTPDGRHSLQLRIGAARRRLHDERLSDSAASSETPALSEHEFIGHMYPTKRNDNVERVTEHAMRHARVHNQLASDKRYAGGIGWCAFDYNTHANFCSTDRICYHGVGDIFRIAKPAGGFYKSQCDPSEEIVLEPAFDWSRGRPQRELQHRDGVFQLRASQDLHRQESRRRYRSGSRELSTPEVSTIRDNMRAGINKGWGDMTLEGYIGGKLVITRSCRGRARQAVSHGCRRSRVEWRRY